MYLINLFIVLILSLSPTTSTAIQCSFLYCLSRLNTELLNIVSYQAGKVSSYLSTVVDALWCGGMYPMMCILCGSRSKTNFSNGTNLHSVPHLWVISHSLVHQLTFLLKVSLLCVFRLQCRPNYSRC